MSDSTYSLNDRTDNTRYINIKRGVVLITITAGWIMVPWKIVYSAASLLNFMTGLAVFLCPIAAIMATDYWLVKKYVFQYYSFSFYIPLHLDLDC